MSPALDSLEIDPSLPWWRLLRPEDAYILLYMVITLPILLGFWGRIDYPAVRLLARAGIAAFVLLIVPFAQRRPNDWTAFLRDMYYMLAFIYFYTETASLHSALWNFRTFDDSIAAIDHALFGFQPSLRFEHALPQALFSEFMNFCYTYYYFLFALGGLVVWLRHDAGWAYSRVLHAVVMTMLFCYLVFDLFPTLGPQFRWNEQHSRDQMAGYFWKYVLDSILEFGERPTGAFPSSHLALATVFMFAFFRYARAAFWISLPFVIGLAASTVYIGVHYFADIPAGIVVGIAGWFISEAVRWAVVRRFHFTPYSPRPTSTPRT